jgi:hypothetical protein
MVQQTAGFGTRCYASGHKTYVVQAAMGGRTRTVTIADCRVITEANARGIARRVLLRVQTGENPAEARVKTKAVPVFAKFLDRYWASAWQAGRHQRWTGTAITATIWMPPSHGGISTRSAPAMSAVGLQGDPYRRASGSQSDF